VKTQKKITEWIPQLLRVCGCAPPSSYHSGRETRFWAFLKFFPPERLPSIEIACTKGFVVFAHSSAECGIETWNKKVREEGVIVVVPEDAQQALLFLAPETGGDFSTLRSTVKGKPGVFVLDHGAFQCERGSLLNPF
jgi:hypothetical protein